MKSKLTLRIEEDVKESVKRLARERGESLSGLVESYFRILTEHSASGAQIGEPTSADGDERSGHSEDLGPKILVLSHVESRAPWVLSRTLHITEHRRKQIAAA